MERFQSFHPVMEFASCGKRDGIMECQVLKELERIHSACQVLVEASSFVPPLAYSHLPPFASHSSQVSLGESTSNPPRAYSYVMPFEYLPNQMSFTTMLMAQDDYNFPSLEALDFSQPILDDTSLHNQEGALLEINKTHG
ncbi:hypothetical protein VNO78_08731 [Psophocarpus tetragonolobus]|uniref:Uncharacterized protein n=1 Tax=Psophocarpus tetragonolobus TaxID=3891 RepID=A0AAN9SVC1_PSOTE